MKSLLGKLGVTLVIGLAIFWYAEAFSFEVDGFKSGMTKKEVKELLNGWNFDRIQEQEDKFGSYIRAYDIPTKNTYRHYRFQFANDKLILLQKHLFPSMKNFILLFDRLTSLYGKPIDSNTRIELSTYGESHEISFLWHAKSEAIDLSYSVFPNNDAFSITYNLGLQVFIK
jgi:hypothetical protein